MAPVAHQLEFGQMSRCDANIKRHRSNPPTTLGAGAAEGEWWG